MTAKDLNLLTDPARLAAWAEQNAISAPPASNNSTNRSGRPRADLSAVPKQGSPAKPDAAKMSEQVRRTASAPAKKTPKHRAATTKKPRPAGDRQWLLTAVIALANMLFIGLAAIWLTGTDLRGSLWTGSSNTLNGTNTSLAALQETNKRLAAVTLELNAVKAQLETLDNKIRPLTPPPQATASSTAPPPSSTTAASTPGADSTTADVASNPVSTHNAEQHPITEPAAPATPPGPTSWQVNLGDYASRKEARVAQRTLQKIGLQAQINPLAESGEQGFLVTISGFADRKDAEAVAGEIMIDTQLNGLWVAKTP